MEEGGLGDDISDLPVAAICPEYYCEKALAIGTYAAASGCYVVFGVRNPVADCTEVVDIMSNGWEETVGGQLVFEPDMEKMLEMVLNRIQEKREALCMNEETERVVLDMADRRGL